MIKRLLDVLEKVDLLEQIKQFFVSFWAVVTGRISDLGEKLKGFIMSLPSDENPEPVTKPTSESPTPPPVTITASPDSEVSKPKPSSRRSRRKKAAPTPSVPSVILTPPPIKVAPGYSPIPIPLGDKEKSLAAKYRDALAQTTVVEFNEGPVSLENAEAVIHSAYRQVFGNAHLMESERLTNLESQMRSGQITVCEFVRQLAKSDLYQSLFWDKYPVVTVIELNFKHLLGRAPESAEEIAHHVEILATGGFDAEIDSYIFSDEYLQNFGDYQVPYFRGYDVNGGKTVVGFTRSFSLFGMACSSDKSMLGNGSNGVATSLQDTPNTIPSIRAIPESVPEALLIPPKPRVSPEIKRIARELLEKRQGYRGY